MRRLERSPFYDGWDDPTIQVRCWINLSGRQQYYVDHDADHIVHVLREAQNAGEFVAAGDEAFNPAHVVSISPITRAEFEERQHQLNNDRLEREAKASPKATSLLRKAFR